MDCKRQEAKRLGTGLQIRFSGFDSRLAVHVAEKPQPQAKNIPPRYDRKSSYHATTPPRSQTGIYASYGNQWQSYADHPYAGCSLRQDSAFYGWLSVYAYRSCPI